MPHTAGCHPMGLRRVEAHIVSSLMQRHRIRSNVKLSEPAKNKLKLKLIRGLYSVECQQHVALNTMNPLMLHYLLFFFFCFFHCFTSNAPGLSFTIYIVWQTNEMISRPDSLKTNPSSSDKFMSKLFVLWFYLMFPSHLTRCENGLT